MMQELWLYLRTILIIKKKKLLCRISLTKKTKYTSFVIVCEARTGSTLLHTYLNSHPGIISHGELLRERLEKKQDVKLPSLKKIVFKSYPQSIHAVGLKMFYSYDDDPLYRDSFQEIMNLLDTRVIHLVREDVLKQFVSLIVAEKTNEWSSVKQSSPSINKKIEIDATRFRDFADTSSKQKEKINQCFKNHSVLNISYEELISTPHETLEKVQRFLTVPPRKLFTVLKKQNPDDIKSLISNYHEVQGYEK